MELTFRLSTQQDVARMMELVQQAQTFFKQNGIDQWQNGYPNPQQLAADIEVGASYVALQDGVVVGTAALYFGIEKDYLKIHEGQWNTGEPYAAIHRVAVDNQCKGQGVAPALYHFLEEVCRTNGIQFVRGDTHRDNIAMQKFMEKMGFSRCGIIYLSDGAERIAYDCTL